MTKKINYLVLFSSYSENSRLDNKYHLDTLTKDEIIELAEKSLERKDYSLTDYTDMEWIDSDDERYDEDLDEYNNGGHYDRPWREGEKLKAAVECLSDDGCLYKIFDSATEVDAFIECAKDYFTDEEINEFLKKHNFTNIGVRK